MSVPQSNPLQSPDFLEPQLQQELRQMFEVDSQQYLQNYLSKTEQLQPQSWTADIQEMYRAIHTIKGGAVTVGAEAILAVAMALEDLLAQLRYLNPAPPLEDGQLSQMLQEAGELMASSFAVQKMSEASTTAVTPTVERLQVLQEQIQQQYLPDWSEQRLVQQEFAEQGFDLVILDLEIALEQLPADNQDLRRNPFSERNYAGCDPGRENGFLEPSCVSPNLLELRDDGRGIDASHIAQIATEQGFSLSHNPNPEQLLAVLCQPGFSSQKSVSAVSGRGVGMDVVATQVASLGGKLSLETEVGSGTVFRLQIPVPHLLVPCVLLKAGDRTFAIPTEEVMTTTIFGKLKATPAADSPIPLWQVQDGAATVPGLDLLDYWHSGSSSPGRSLSETATCVYVSPGENSKQGVWLLADELLGQKDLPIEPLPVPLVSPVGLVGVSLEIDGTLIPVLEATAIAERLLLGRGDAPAAPTAAAIAGTIGRQAEDWTHLNRTILVVDDAALMRRRIEASLAASGYTVHTCADGQEAWHWLQNNPQPLLLITDIEMPNMDGFTLIDRCRQQGIVLPILVISSRLSEEWGREARRLGANDYLTKGFSPAELLTKVSALSQ